MRFVFAALLLVAAGSAHDTARADPYRWCAEYNTGGGGGSNCYFVTLEQCRAAVSGVGGFCRQSPWGSAAPATGTRRGRG